MDAAETVESMCHWTQGRGNARAESHGEFHYGSPCPYASMAAVLRGEQDPRDDCDHGGSPGVTVCRYCAPDEAGDEKRPWAKLDNDAQQSADVIERWAPRTAAVIRYRSGVVELQRRHDALTAEVARCRAEIEKVRNRLTDRKRGPVGNDVRDAVWWEGFRHGLDCALGDLAAALGDGA